VIQGFQVNVCPVCGGELVPYAPDIHNGSTVLTPVECLKCGAIGNAVFVVVYQRTEVHKGAGENGP